MKGLTRLYKVLLDSSDDHELVLTFLCCDRVTLPFTYCSSGIQKPSILISKNPKQLESYDGKPVTATIGDTITILRGASVAIGCVAIGSPKPGITWLKDGQGIVPTERLRVSENGSLVISKALVSDTAQYTCVAGNAYGTAQETSSLIVIGMYWLGFPCG